MVGVETVAWPTLDLVRGLVSKTKSETLATPGLHMHMGTPIPTHLYNTQTHMYLSVCVKCRHKCFERTQMKQVHGYNRRRGLLVIPAAQLAYT